ncbi:glycosyltransferase family 2 protein [Celeribacter indicus]|uniref:Glycosyltransferase 2-like domain-containing protein n=1 Tax=Celeribacter indicus TaxID=1208324 RepID=A0A0B5E2P8_9RHOB|nr:hypothetical protein [Celeribacter indicus]AJE47301.1 hypothetical protein P73_2586 [Celeribacter indicus]SDW02845.1 hypothetical protein SAMN05443573_101140 [Celeribacter indicus]
MDEIDLCLVACRRPDLLRVTLASFRDNLLRQAPLRQAYVNIDPFMGDACQEAEAVEIVRDHFPEAVIFTPERPGFCEAVKRVWSHTTAPAVLHLEDDWVLEEPVDPCMLLARLDERTRAVSFLSQEHGSRGMRAFSEARTRRRILGVPYRRCLETRFNTSPGLFDGAFLRRAAEMLDPELDPEKQMRRSGGNRGLYDMCQSFRCAFHKAGDGSPIVRDIGRDWRDRRGIKKVLSGGRSQWTTAEGRSVAP